MITLIPNQQFIFDFAYDSCNSSDNKRYCQLIQEDDNIYFQFKQNPCSDNLICNSDFIIQDTEAGPDLVTNGNFAGSSAGWSISGVTWVYAAAPNRLRTNTNGTGAFEQNIGSIISGAFYELTFTIINSAGLVDGTIQPVVGGNEFGGLISANGTYTLYGICGNLNTNLHFDSQTPTGNGFAIQNISLRQIYVDCWLADNNSLTVNSGSLCHVSGEETNVVQEGSLVTGCYYKVVIEIANRTQGNVVVKAGTDESDPITANGTQTVYLLSDSSDLTIVMSELFDGCITLATVYLLRTDFQVTLKDVNDNWIADLNPLKNPSTISLDNEYVTFSLPMNLGTITDVSDVPQVVDWDCYKFCIYDPCEISRAGVANWVDPMEGFTVGAAVNFSNAINEGGWFMHRSGGGAASAILTMNAGGYPVNLWSHAAMRMIVDVRITTGVIQETSNHLYLNLPNNQKILLATNIASNTTYVYHQIVDVTNTVGATYQDQIRLIFEAGASATDNLNYIRFVAITALPMNNRATSFNDSNAEYCSNCLSWQQVHNCTKVLVGEPATSVINSVGFNFTHFILQNRLRILSFNPSYFQEEEDYLFSDGRRQITYSQSEKYKTLLFDYVDEVTHDNINALINSSSLTMEGTELYVKKGEYAPDWDKDGRQKTAQSRIQAKVKDNTIFNTLCS